MRCWALAEEMRALGAKVVWHGRIDVPWVRRALDQVPWSIHEVHGSPSEQARKVAADIVVVDSYTLDVQYREDLMQRGIPVVAITDDSVLDVGAATLWVNPGAPIDSSLPEGIPSLNGPDYVLIRRKVRKFRRTREEGLKTGNVQGLTFILGGTDFGGLASEVRAFEVPQSRLGSVFAGPGSQTIGGDIKWIEGGDELLKKAALSRLVVAGAGVTSWELAHIGVPMALVQVANNQAGNYRWMTQRGWAWPLDYFGHDGSTSLLDQVQRALSALEDGSIDGRSRIDGLGAQRVAKEAVSLL